MIRKQGIAISKIVLFVLFAVLFMTSVQPVSVYAKGQDVTKTISASEKQKMKDVIREACELNNIYYISPPGYYDGVDHGEYSFFSKENWDFTKNDDIKRMMRVRYDSTATEFGGTTYFSLKGQLFERADIYDIYDSKEYSKKLFGKAVNITGVKLWGDPGEDWGPVGRITKVVRLSKNNYRVDKKYLYLDWCPIIEDSNKKEVEAKRSYNVSFFVEKNHNSFYGYILKKAKVTKSSYSSKFYPVEYVRNDPWTSRWEE